MRNSLEYTQGAAAKWAAIAQDIRERNEVLAVLAQECAAYWAAKVRLLLGLED